MTEWKELKFSKRNPYSYHPDGTRQLHRTDICYTPEIPLYARLALQFYMEQPAIKVYRVYQN